MIRCGVRSLVRPKSVNKFNNFNKNIYSKPKTFISSIITPIITPIIITPIITTPIIITPIIPLRRFSTATLNCFTKSSNIHMKSDPEHKTPPSTSNIEIKSDPSTTEKKSNNKNNNATIVKESKDTIKLLLKYLSLRTEMLLAFGDRQIKGVYILHLYNISPDILKGVMPVFPDVKYLFVEETSSEFIEDYIKHEYFPSVTKLFIRGRPGIFMRSALSENVNVYVTEGGNEYDYGITSIEDMEINYSMISVDHFNNMLCQFSNNSLNHWR